MNVSLASIQHAIKVTKAKSKLYYRVVCSICHLPKICRWWKLSLLQGATLRDIVAQGEITAMQPHCLEGRVQRKLT